MQSQTDCTVNTLYTARGQRERVTMTTHTQRPSHTPTHSRLFVCVSNWLWQSWEQSIFVRCDLVAEQTRPPHPTPLSRLFGPLSVDGAVVTLLIVSADVCIKAHFNGEVLFSTRVNCVFVLSWTDCSLYFVFR